MLKYFFVPIASPRTLMAVLNLSSNQSTAKIKATSVEGRPTVCKTITIVTNPACGIPISKKSDMKSNWILIFLNCQRAVNKAKKTLSLCNGWIFLQLYDCQTTAWQKGDPYKEMKSQIFEVIHRFLIVFLGSHYEMYKNKSCLNELKLFEVSGNPKKHLLKNSFVQLKTSQIPSKIWLFISKQGKIVHEIDL